MASVGLRLDSRGKTIPREVGSSNDHCRRVEDVQCSLNESTAHRGEEFHRYSEQHSYSRKAAVLHSHHRNAICSHNTKTTSELDVLECHQLRQLKLKHIPGFTHLPTHRRLKLHLKHTNTYSSSHFVFNNTV